MSVPTVNLKATLSEGGVAWRAALKRVFTRGQFILGPEGERFEQEFAAATGARFAIGVGSGTGALELSLRAAELPPGSEVLTTPLTAPFTGIGILAAGMRIRFADIDPGTLQLDAASAAERMTNHIRAIIPVHLYGQACEVGRFRALARAAKAVLIQDAAQAHGLRIAGRPLTDFSDYVAYSFYPTKNLGALGDGGAVATNRAAIHKRIRRLRDGGRGPNMVSLEAGINCRLDEVQAALLRAFLPHLDSWNRRRASLAALYDEGLRDCPGVTLVRRDPSSVHHLYVIRARRRERLRGALASEGIGTAIHYPVPLHLHPAFAGCGLKRGDLPNAESACREIVSLPLWPRLPHADARRVVEVIRRFYGR